MEAVFEQRSYTTTQNLPAENPFGDKIGLLAKVFGCWHNRDLSRPFADKNKAYRVCLDCGARRAFNTQTLETFGPYYFPPTVSLGLKR